MDNRPRPWLRPADQAMRLPIDQVVTNLRTTIGARLVAYVGRVTSTSVVSAWADGSEVPDSDTASRLRTAFEVALILGLRWGPTTIGSWFMGMNPDLGDESPARAIRQWPPGDHHSVLVAARSAMIE